MAGYRHSRWDLSALAGGRGGRRAPTAQIRELQEQARRFEKTRPGLRPGMSSRKFMGMIRRIERITEGMSRIGGHASLSYAADTQSDEATSLLRRVTKINADIENSVLFFDLWWKTAVDQGNADRLIRGAGELRRYLQHKRLSARYSLSEKEERIINTLDVTGASALVRLYDKITNAYAYRMAVNGRERTMTREEITGMTRSADPDVRKTAYRTVLSRYSQDAKVLGEIYQNVALNWSNEGVEIRGYRTPISMRNLANDTDDRTVGSLLASCRANAGVFQGFFAHKARVLGKRRLRRYDLYAPMSAAAGGGGADAGQKRYTYARAARLVLEALGEFSTEMEALARRVFDENHVDSAARHGKMDGAFCSTITPKTTPYVLLNFTGRTRDVFTMAHELGHAIHSMAARGRSILVHQAPLPLAETASTFSELLLYDSLSGKIPDRERSDIMAEKIDDLYATIMRQAYFTMFEIDAHEMIRAGTTVDGISGAYMRGLGEQFGRSVSVSGDFAAEWSCIPHFYHTPFYCYAYSFGNLLALSLFRRYKREGADFAPAYAGILEAGGSKKPEDLLSEHGLDIGSRKFWQEGFDYVRDQVRAVSRAGGSP